MPRLYLFVKMSNYICQNCKKIFVKIWKVIFLQLWWQRQIGRGCWPNCKIYLSKLQKVFVKIAEFICLTLKSDIFATLTAASNRRRRMCRGWWPDLTCHWWVRSQTTTYFLIIIKITNIIKIIIIIVIIIITITAVMWLWKLLNWPCSDHCSVTNRHNYNEPHQRSLPLTEFGWNSNKWWSIFKPL